MCALCPMLKVMSTHQQISADTLGDYCDGRAYKSHPLFSTDPVALQLIIYYDELELCNPLGSRRKKHKIGNNIVLTKFDPYHFHKYRSILLSSWKHESNISIKDSEHPTSDVGEILISDQVWN